MRVLFLFISLSFLQINVKAQFNMSLLGHLNYDSLHQTELNDIWGYVDTLGNEYALVGCQKGTSVVDVTDGTNPIEKIWVPGMESVWRDIKTWNKHAYVTTEAQNGLLILDLSNLPNISLSDTIYYFGDTDSTSWQSAHNLYIDENGICYIFGANRDNGGVIMLDLTDPKNPVEIGTFDTWYVHDGMVRNDTMYLAHINDGHISIVDVTDKSNPVLLGIESTPSTFSHNIWISDDGQYAYTTDEVSNAFIGAYDISDPSDIEEVDRIQSNSGSGVIPHNTHFINDYIVTSYYRDGVTIHDVSDPENMVEVGNYDSSPLQGNGFNGDWGAYPWLPSGNVIISDIENGLFVLNANYVRGCYLQGRVTDAVSTASISNATIEILNNNLLENSDLAGDYKTGIGQAGFYNIRFYKSGYHADTIFNVNLSNGITTTLNVALEPRYPFSVTINVKDAITGLGVDSAMVFLQDEEFEFTEYTDSLGNVTLGSIYMGNFKVAAGKWGYVTECEEIYLDTSVTNLNYQLDYGYYDDFIFDFGWDIIDSTHGGAWERGEPIGTYNSAQTLVFNPEEDAINDCFGFCYVTSNDGGTPVSSDLDKGFTVLTSPEFDVTSYNEPYLNYRLWFVNAWGDSTINDSLLLYLDNGIDTILIDSITHNSLNLMHQWNARAVRIEDYAVNNTPFKLMVKATDYEGSENLMEAGFDYFLISEGDVTSVIKPKENEILIYPNPTNGKSIIAFDRVLNSEISIFNLDGKLIKKLVSDTKEVNIDLSNLSSGVYFLAIKSEDGKTEIRKLLKTN